MVRMTAAQATGETLKREGITHVRLGCNAIRVFEPDDILPVLERAKRLIAEFGVPVVEVILERVTNVETR